MKLRRVEVSETVCSLLYRSRLAEVTWEALSVVSLILSSIWHVGSDVHQTGYRWIRPRLGNYRSPIAVTDKNAWSTCLSKVPLVPSTFFLKQCFGPLTDLDFLPTLTRMS